MTVDLDTWRRLKDAQEQSAFRAWAAALTRAGQPVTLPGISDSEQDRYARRFGSPREVLTTDAHVALDGQEIYIDHTSLAMGGLPAAVREASETLNRELAGAALISPTGGLRITVVPQTGATKERRRYYARLAAFGRRAAQSGRPVPDPDAAPDASFPCPVAEPWTPPSPEQLIDLRIAQPLSWQLRRTLAGWRHSTSHIRDLLGASIAKKLTACKLNGRPGQLARAAGPGAADRTPHRRPRRLADTGSPCAATSAPAAASGHGGPADGLGG
ncbi:hypothetical protein [Streptomyces sp. STCH 565 A]|uniref:hypothetical protein n=1 Tax=Streptomyces sp. STCH 565 A TaxID=2950532 RepID=UPI00207635E8|nr:hypothetical protein [Streptomyces sp. STCH 565 A]MCM8555415.1 hypothetical protein [Streptomyces sp. STCH 565 A]